MCYYSTSEPLNFKGVEEGWVGWLYFSLRARFFFYWSKKYFIFTYQYFIYIRIKAYIFLNSFKTVSKFYFLIWKVEDKKKICINVQTEIVFVFYKFLKQKISYTILLDKKSDDIFSIRSIHMSSNKISTNTRTADTSSSQRSEIWNRKKFTKKWNSIKSLKSLKFSFWYLRSSYFHQRIFDMKFVVLWISSVNKTTCSCSWETVVFQRWRNVKLLYKDDAKKAKSELYFF